MEDLTNKNEAPVPEAVPPVSDPARIPRGGTKRNSLSFGVVVGAAVVIAVLLVGVGYATYRGTNKKAAPLTSSQDAEQSTGESLDRTSEVDEQVVDNELEQIDEEVKDLDNSVDFDDKELSDQALGL